MRVVKIKQLLNFLECQKKHFFDDILKLKGEKSEFIEFKYNLLKFVCEHVFKTEGLKNVSQISVPFADVSDCKSETEIKLAWEFNQVKREWFTLNREMDQEINRFRFQLERYFNFEKQQTRNVFAYNLNYAAPLVDYGLIVRGTADLVFREGDNFEAIKFKLSSPELSSAARNPENSPENSVELALMYLGLSKVYPGIRVSFYHLANKDDKAENFVDTFNHKPNKNIVSAVFTEDTAMKVVANALEGKREDLQKLCAETAGSYSYSQLNNESCKDCKFCVLCDEKANPEVIGSPDYSYREPKLNKKQFEAVDSIQCKATRIIAPPGSGKTATLAARAKHIMVEGVDYRNILLLSFSNKAVEELKKRVINSTWLCGDDVEVHTFNSFCYQLVKRYADRLGLQNPKLLTKATRLRMVERILDRISDGNMQVSYLYPKGEYGIIRKVDSIVSNLIDGIEVKDVDPDFLSYCTAIARAIREEMTSKEYITYKDQIALTCRLFDENPDIPAQLGGRYRYIMVDEYQDTDDLQHEVVKRIGVYSKNVCVCADDDQSLYGFRNANIGNLLDFKNFFKDCVDIVLDTNYRSGSNIVQIAHRLIKSNKNRVEKVIYAASDMPGSISYENITSFEDIPEVITREVGKGRLLKDITIIGRKNSTLDNLYRILCQAGIACRMPVSTLTEDPSFRKFLAYLKCIYGKFNDYDLYLLKNYKLEEDLTRLHESVQAKLSSYNTESFKKELRRILCVFGCPARVIYCLEKLVNDEGILGFNDLFERLMDIVEYDESIVIEDDLIYNAVTLITAHSSKGKEYPCVIIPNIHEYTVEEGKDMEEERRVLYVAMTRAKNSLIILDKAGRRESPFAKEVQSAMNEFSMSVAV